MTQLKEKSMDEVKEILSRIEEERGIIKPRYVLEEARNVESPLHGYFIWDDTEAAENYRLSQAAQLIVSVKVTIQERKVSAFQAVRVVLDEKPVSGYLSTAKVLNNEDMKSQVIAKAVKEIEYWDKQYNDISELSGLVNREKVKEVSESIKKK